MRKKYVLINNKQADMYADSLWQIQTLKLYCGFLII